MSLIWTIFPMINRVIILETEHLILSKDANERSH